MQRQQAFGRTASGRVLERTLALLLVLSLVFGAAASLAPRTALAAGNIEEIHDHAPDYDVSAGARVAPSASQLRAASGLRAASARGGEDAGLDVRWNDFGTPKSLSNFGGDGLLARGIKARSAEAAARAWLKANAGLYKQTPASVDRLELVSAGGFKGTNGYAVHLRQRFGGLPVTYNGSVTVAVKGSERSGWSVVYASSSLAGDTRLAAPARLSAAEAYRIAAGSVGRKLSGRRITTSASRTSKGGWTTLKVGGASQDQRIRKVAFPTPTNGVRPAWETIVLKADAGDFEAFSIFVDAADGTVLRRQDQVVQAADYIPRLSPGAMPQARRVTRRFSGEFSETQCGPNHNFDVAAGTKQIIVFAQATPAPQNQNDIVLLLSYRGELVAVQDTFTTPESLRYLGPNGDGNIPAGRYTVNVCPFSPEGVEPPYTYDGTFTTDDQPLIQNPLAAWKFFPANPTLTYRSRDNRVTACWNTIRRGDRLPRGCGIDIANLAARQVWDTVGPILDNRSTFTTLGNAAFTQESWDSFFGPGPTFTRPVKPNRRYVDGWRNEWNEARCNPAVFADGVDDPSVPGNQDTDTNANDRLSATTNLFVNHNRMHDWSYFLGFTETEFNAQFGNFGLTRSGAYPRGLERDPEVGQAQAGGRLFGYRRDPGAFRGRDNANQFTPPDGQAPITNMYLWQPLTGAFYAPCVDGDFDMSVIAHEYGHLIQNRMVAGPDAQLSGHQARAMGESWSDLTAIEYLNEYGYVPTNGENPYAVGAYATGNRQEGIRNYAMNRSDLNYSDLEYDPNGVASPHADGEIWSAANFDIREALIAKYNRRFPASDRRLQRRCADGELPADYCPGNRRWFQVLMDAFLLMPSQVTMVDARDAYLAADRIRFGGANQTEMWRAFARRGLGVDARSPVTRELTSPRAVSGAAVENRDPVPSFRSPRERAGTITFRVRGANGRNVRAEIFVGRYEARVVPIADTDARTRRSSAARFVAGRYTFTVNAPGYGHFRFARTVRAGSEATLEITLARNVASRYQGARASGPGPRSALETNEQNLNRLIDDTENTNYRRLNAPVRGTSVTVNLAGGRQRITRVQVSALPRPRDIPTQRGADPDPQSRFSALRSFEILACTASSANGNCSRGGFRTIYRSPADAFPAGRPRPLAPDLTLKGFDVRDVTATHVRLRVLTSQCTGAPAYQGEQDRDPRYNTDCDTGTRVNDPILPSQGRNVRAAELQVFGERSTVREVQGDQQPATGR